MCADHTKPKKTELQVVKPAPTVPTTAGDSNPWLDVAGERIGKILKFNKGIWLIQTEEIAPGTRYIAGIDQLSREWIRFQDDGQPPIRHRFKVANKEAPPPRETLGDSDPKKWDKDADGKPKDPWVLQWLLPLMPEETFELVVFCTSTNGGDGCVRDLCGIYGRSKRNGMLPIVALKSSSYLHRERKTKIFVPVLEIVSWDGGNSVVDAAPPLAPSENEYGADWSDPIDNLEAFK
jgi:hypothetical protein